MVVRLLAPLRPSLLRAVDRMVGQARLAGSARHARRAREEGAGGRRVLILTSLLSFFQFLLLLLLIHFLLLQLRVILRRLAPDPTAHGSRAHKW